MARELQFPFLASKPTERGGEGMDFLRKLMVRLTESRRSLSTTGQTMTEYVLIVAAIAVAGYIAYHGDWKPQESKALSTKVTNSLNAALAPRRGRRIRWAAVNPLARPIVTASPVVSPRFRHALGNTLVAASFVVAAIPNAKHFFRSPADAIWTIGAVLMAAMSLVRIAPKAARLDLHAFLSTIFPVFLLPCLLRADVASSGALAWAGVGLELLGVALSQVSRVYMGRSFGILPGNRGIVSTGLLSRWCGTRSTPPMGSCSTVGCTPQSSSILDELPHHSGDATLHDVADPAGRGPAERRPRLSKVSPAGAVPAGSGRLLSAAFLPLFLCTGCLVSKVLQAIR